MKGMLKLKLKLKLKLIWIVVVVDDDCLDLPLLTTIECLNNCTYIHYRMGRVILESMI